MINNERFKYVWNIPVILDLYWYTFSFSVFFQLNQNVTSFQRKFVNEIKRCEEMERILGKNLN